MIRPCLFYVDCFLLLLLHSSFFRCSLFHSSFFRCSLFHSGFFRGGLFHSGFFRRGLFHSGFFRSGLFQQQPFSQRLFSGRPFSQVLFSQLPFFFPFKLWFLSVFLCTNRGVKKLRINLYLYPCHAFNFFYLFRLFFAQHYNKMREKQIKNFM